MRAIHNKVSMALLPCTMPEILMALELKQNLFGQLRGSRVWWFQMWVKATANPVTLDPATEAP